MFEFLKPFVKIDKMIITRIDPTIAQNGKKYNLKKSLAISSEPITIEIAAPNAAPDETPINPGSASGFLNKPCKHDPDNANEAPTNPAKITLGALIFNRTNSSISFVFPKRKSKIDIS